MKKKIYLGMAARMVPDKLHYLLLEIISENRLFFFENNIKFFFAGDGYLIKSLKKKVSDEKISKLTIFNGTLKEDDLIKWFRKIDIYIHLSKDETTSTSIIQAMSMATPIIASKIGGNKNLLKSKNNLKNIILVNNNKHDVFIKIKQLINNKIKRKKMSKFARFIAEKFYSCERMFKEYKKLF